MSARSDVPTGPIQPGLTTDQLAEHLITECGLTRDRSDRWDLTMVATPAQLREAVLHLRDAPNLRFAMLLDIAGVDYLAYPDHRGARFAVVYLFKSLVFRHRVALKVWIEEDQAVVPSIHDLFKSADWAERETWDQYGIVFTGHPNLKRLLNHHEFVGHPLRKDYPCQKRQKLSANDMMIDQLEARLRQRGYTIVEHGESHPGAPISDPAAVPLGDRGRVARGVGGNEAGAIGSAAPASVAPAGAAPGGTVAGAKP